MPEGLELRTDHGPQYTGRDCEDLCSRWGGIEHTFAPVGRPTGNAVAERVIRSGLGQAIGYMLDRWAGLTAFVKDARIPLDNNAERALRGVALGRKNHYGSRSRRGAEVAAIYYSLFESAKLCGVDPKKSLLQAAQAAAVPGTVTLPSSLIP